MVSGTRVIYPRAVFRTWRASLLCLMVIYATMLAGIAFRARGSPRPGIDFWLLAGLTFMPLALSIKTLAVLRQLELVRQEPDTAMAALLDVSISLPVMCLAFVATVLWLLD